MNKRFFKFLMASSVVFTLTAPLMTVEQNTAKVVAASQKQKTVKMAVYKYSKNHKKHTKSMAQAFVGNKVQLTIKAKRVNKMVIHVDGNNSPMGKNQRVDQIVKSLKINGVNGKKENISADHSSFDFVFSGKAFKNNGWAKMQVTIDFGGKMTESAWVKFSKVSGLKQKKSVKKHKKVSKKASTPKKLVRKATTVDTDKKEQTISYAVYKADHGGVSAANNFYTHRAQIKKQRHGYTMALKVAVKRGLVTQFEPLNIGIGRIFDRHFTRNGKQDIWTYQVRFTSLKQLKKPAKGTLRLSVPIANIHHRIFKVWFAFGVKDVAQKKVLPVSANSDLDNDQDQGTPQANQAPNSEEETPAKQSSQNQVNSDKVRPKANQASPAAPSKIKHKAMAEVALIKYPFLPVIAAFVLLDAIIVIITLLWRRKILKKAEK